MPHVMEALRTCIDACTRCHQVCLETIAHCLMKGGPHAAADHIRLLQDCAQICQTSADFMIRGSDAHRRTCGVCAEVCERCAASCDAFGDDPDMKACAAECRRCAEECRRMAA